MRLLAWCPSAPYACGRSFVRGFTLIEMLVALSVMALLALMSWRGLDAMLRTHQTVASNNAVLQSLQGGLAQWQIDLDALVETPYVNAVEWDGRVLRVLRRSPAGGPEGLAVVAWTLGSAGPAGPALAVNAAAGGAADAAVPSASEPHWLRWQSRPLQGRADLLAAWAEAGAWQGGTEALAQSVAVSPLQAWQLQYFRAGQWTAADSLLSGGSGGGGSGGNLARASVGDMPEGLRLVLELPGGPGQVLQGTVRSDWFNPLSGAAR